MYPFENNSEQKNDMPSAQTNGNTQTPSDGYHWHNTPNAYSSSNTPHVPVQQSPWRTSSGSASYGAAAAPQKKKAKTGRFFLALTALLLCCAIASAGTLAVFVSLIQQGKLEIANLGTSSDPVYQIVKVEKTPNTSGTLAVTGSVRELSDSEIAKKILPSIVCIQNYQTRNSQNPFIAAQGNETPTPASEGSGIIASSDGYIVTNAHVVNGADSLKVVTYDGDTYEAQLIGSDSMTDLALIKIDAQGLQAASFGSSDDLEIGDKVVAAGNPGGMEFSFSITVGHVSALNRSIVNGETGYTLECIQTDAAVSPGNSGGALVNQYGQVIGVVSSKIASTAFEGLSFAIPSNSAQPILDDLKTYGYVKDRAVIGISGGFVDQMTANLYGFDPGWYIGEVTSPLAEQAGLQKGDVITKIDGEDVTSGAVISTAIAQKKPGDTVTLTISRASEGSTFDVDVVLSESAGSIRPVKETDAG